MEPVFEEQFSTACIYDGQLFSFSLNPVIDDKYLIELIRILLIKKMYIASINNTKTDENDKFAETLLCVNHYARDFHVRMFNTVSSLIVF